jgi:hypothetical protein
MLAVLVLAISVCAVRLPAIQAKMTEMAGPAIALAQSPEAVPVSLSAGANAAPECCEIQPVFLSAISSVVVLVVLTVLVVPSSRVLTPLPQIRASRTHFGPPGLRGRAALFASLTWVSASVRGAAA